MAELVSPWFERLRAVGKAQSRFLWILLVMMIFYAALQHRITSSPGSPGLRMPVVDVEIESGTVLASGTAVLSFLLLSVLGTMRAYDRARHKLGLSEGADWSGEELDTAPNAIDFAFYTEPDSPKIIATVTHFGYPIFLLVALAEAAWLWWNLVADVRIVRLWRVFALVGALLWIVGTWQVMLVWYRRIRGIPTVWKTTE